MELRNTYITSCQPYSITCVTYVQWTNIAQIVQIALELMGSLAKSANVLPCFDITSSFFVRQFYENGARQVLQKLLEYFQTTPNITDK